MKLILHYNCPFVLAFNIFDLIILMKKVPPKDNITKIGRTHASKNNSNNISLNNKRGISSEDKYKKSLFKNFLEFKKSTPFVEKNKASKTEHEQSREAYNIYLNSNVMATATSTSLNNNLNNSLGCLNGFELIEKIFRFMKSKIPSELYVKIT
jgi:hypothetical protein